MENIVMILRISLDLVSRWPRGWIFNFECNFEGSMVSRHWDVKTVAFSETVYGTKKIQDLFP